MIRTLFLGTLLSLLLSFAGHTPAIFQHEHADSGINYFSTANKIEITSMLTKADKDGWEFDLRIDNHGMEPIYIMSDPIRANGKRGAYISFDENDLSVLLLSIRLYPSPKNYVFTQAERQ